MRPGRYATSLFEAGEAEGVPVAIMGEVIHAFSYDVDFQRDIQPGDKFEIVYKRYMNEAGGKLAKIRRYRLTPRSPSAGAS